MKRIVSGSDAIINLELKDSSGNIIPLYSSEVVNTIDIVIYTKNTDSSNYIHITSIDDLADNHIKLQSTELDKLKREQIFIDVNIQFFCDEFDDGYFDYKNKLATNLILV